MSLVGSAARQLRAALAVAPDSALGRIVGVLDSMGERGGTDELLADVRPRLRRLRPPRPLRFTRLLALPLEGVLVAPTAWKATPAEIPRSALLPLNAAVRAAIGAEAEAIEAAALGRTTADLETIGALGARLWSLAGAASLPAPPPGWAESGLPRDAAAPMVALAGALWRHGAALWAARLAGADGPSEALLRATLGPIVPEGPAAVAGATMLLLRHAAAPGRVAWVAGGFAPPVALLAERALGEVLTAHAAAVAVAAGPAEMAESAAALAQRLEDAEAHDLPGNRDLRRRQLAQLRRDGAEGCRACFERALEAALLQPAAELARGAARAADEEVARLEAAARGLRRLERAGRRLGQESAFDRATAQAVPKLLGLGAATRGLTRVDLARLVEILAGPEAALPLLAVEVERA